MGNTSTHWTRDSSSSRPKLCEGSKRNRLDELNFNTFTPEFEAKLEHGQKIFESSMLNLIEDNNDNNSNEIRNNDQPSLYTRVGGLVFVEMIVEQLELNDSDLQRNVRVDLQGALTRTTPFDATYKTQVVNAVEEMDLSKGIKNEVLLAIDDAAIFTLTGRRCPMSGTLQRDELHLCPITKLGFEIAKDRSSLLKQLGSEGLEASCELWTELIEKDANLRTKFKRDASIKGYLRQILTAILANDKKNRELPQLGIDVGNDEFDTLVALLGSALGSAGVRPMISSEACNRMHAWWNSTPVGSLANITVTTEEDTGVILGSIGNGSGLITSMKGNETETSTEAITPDVVNDGDDDCASMTTELSGLAEIPLITRIGGEEAIRALMERFYGDLEKHASLGPIFRAAKNKDVRARHTSFLTDLIQGATPEVNLQTMHAPLRVTGQQFDQFMAQFSSTAARMISVDVLSELLGILSRYELIIVAPKPVIERKPKKFRMLPPDYVLPTSKERALFSMHANLHWPTSARQDMKAEIEKKMEKLRPKTGSNKGSFVPSLDSATSMFANLTLEGAHVPMERPENVQLPKDFRSELGVISLERLASYRATKERMLMSVYGYIFDVSDRPDKYGVGAPYEELTGKDITWGLASGDDSPPNANKFYDMFKRAEEPTVADYMKGKKAPDYDELYQRISGLLGWVHHYTNEYGPPVGRLDLYENEESLPSPPKVQLGCSIA